MKQATHWILFFSILLSCPGALLAQAELFKDPKTGKKGLFHSLEGYFILPVNYDDIQEVYPVDSLWIVRKGALKGLFSESGRAIIPIQYDEIEATPLIDTGTGHGN